MQIRDMLTFSDLVKKVSHAEEGIDGLHILRRNIFQIHVDAKSFPSYGMRTVFHHIGIIEERIIEDVCGKLWLIIPFFLKLNNV